MKVSALQPLVIAIPSWILEYFNNPICPDQIILFRDEHWENDAYKILDLTPADLNGNTAKHNKYVNLVAHLLAVLCTLNYIQYSDDI